VLAQSKDDLAFDVQHIRSIIYFDKMGYEWKFKEDLHRPLRKRWALPTAQVRLRPLVQRGADRAGDESDPAAVSDPGGTPV
jgi:hypothetical protein